MTDIGDVDDMIDGVSLQRQRSPQRVGEYVGAQIAEMGEIINGWAAAIDTCGMAVAGREPLQAARQAVEKCELGSGHRHAR